MAADANQLLGNHVPMGRDDDLARWFIESFVSCKCKKHRSNQTAEQHPQNQPDSSHR